MKKAFFILSLIAFATVAIVFSTEASAFAHLVTNETVSLVNNDVTQLAGMSLATTALPVMSVEQLEKEAGKLSYFEGGQMQFYTGQEDDLLSFEGDIRSFAQELDKNLEKQFTVSVVNANAATRTAVLFAGYLLGNTTLVPGQLIEGAFNDINGNAGLTGATGENKSIQELNLFLNYCPTRMLAMKIQSTVPGQLNTNLTYRRNNPFKDEESRLLRPKNFINQDTYQNDQVTFPVDVQIDVLTNLRMPFVGASTTFVTWYFGASLNIMSALEKKAQRARVNINAVGVDKVIQATRTQKALGN